MRETEFVVMVAAVLMSGTTTSPEEAVAKAKALIAVAQAAEKREGDN